MQEDFLQRLRNGSLTAAIVSNADTALRLCQLCTEHNIRIPKDLSVLYFDNPNSGKQPTGSFLPIWNRTLLI
ncbi:MAG: substrate-binding domain-containing protein [Lachnospiraceae bacterium]|nr:substrate-binding domain-containing protein [Lachnospiraceae bacterium]MCI9097510.1 substrate-binding domain-containing protein [Lachnospiraceae bacterium]MCI9202416.1 substrate-binding domain-containing protein [Lachnospiraceae bacterium]